MCYNLQKDEMWGNDMIAMLFIYSLLAAPLVAVAVIITALMYKMRDLNNEKQCSSRKKALKFSLTVLIVILVILGLIFLIWGRDLAEI